MTGSLITKKVFDLEERTEKFGELIIGISQKIKPTNITTPLINQFIRAGTSVGANYMEANNASSKKDFRNKIYICKKEAQETKYWLKMLMKAAPEMKDQLEKVLDEAHQLVLIFHKICSSLNN